MQEGERRSDELTERKKGDKMEQGRELIKKSHTALLERRTEGEQKATLKKRNRGEQ